MIHILHHDDANTVFRHHGAMDIPDFPGVVRSSTRLNAKMAGKKQGGVTTSVVWSDSGVGMSAAIQL
ncbi:MAG TPA: hypothetical protein VEZ12_22270 [Herpetosiphonaceae bacterium]|nr:hypothetical protein [Herpetosiphonaceae bacterium]